MKYNLSVQKSDEIHMYICFDSRARTGNLIVIGRAKSDQMNQACTSLYSIMFVIEAA